MLAFLFRIEHGDGGQKYIIVSGKVEIPEQTLSKFVVVVTKKLQPTLEVSARMTESMTILTAVAYSAPLADDEDVDEEALRKELVTEAINVRREKKRSELASKNQNRKPFIYIFIPFYDSPSSKPCP